MTPTQRRVLWYVKDFITEEGYSPTVRQIGSGCDMSSPATVQWHLDALRELGYIKGEGRSLRTTDTYRSNWGKERPKTEES